MKKQLFVIEDNNSSFLKKESERTGKNMSEIINELIADLRSKSFQKLSEYKQTSEFTSAKNIEYYVYSNKPTNIDEMFVVHRNWAGTSLQLTLSDKENISKYSNK